MIIIHCGKQKALVVEELNSLIYLLRSQRCGEMQIQLLSRDTSGCIVPGTARTKRSPQLIDEPLVRA
jgi:hypothetical protein